MGTKPFAGALGLLWVGLAFSCLAGPGCMGTGQKKPFPPQGSIRENPFTRPPANGSSPFGGSDLNKQSTLPGAPVGTPSNAVPGDSNKLMGNPANSGGSNPTKPALMQTGATTTTGFEKGPKVPPGKLPGNTPAGGQEKTGKSSLDPLPPLGSMGTQTANFGKEAVSKEPTPRPLASGGSLLPRPPGPGRDPITGTSTPMPISGAPANPLPPADLALPPSPEPVVPVSTSGYTPTNKKPITTTTAPPVPGLPGDYTAPGANLTGDVLPPIGSPTP